MAHSCPHADPVTVRPSPWRARWPFNPPWLPACGALLIRVLLVSLAGIAGLAAPGAAAAEAPVTLAVLAFRPVPETQARWQATADYLSARTGRRFILQAMTYTELESAIQQRRVEFVLTNPSHYVQMTKRNGLSSPLATLIELENGISLANFGGVIFIRSGRKDIASLADLRGRTIATPDIGSLGGYQMQAAELQRAGISPTREVHHLITGMPHDKAVYAVLEGRADAGFVRTGVLESLARDGRIEPGRIAVLSRRLAPGFPFQLSTPLYPEWPFAAMPQTDPRLAQQVAKALYSMPEDDPAARQGHYHGWTIPTDYEPVRALLQELRLPPFDRAPAFTWQDVLDKHWLGIVLTGTGGLTIAILLFMLTARQRQLREQEHRLARERHQLLAALGEGVYGVDLEGRCTFVNPAALALLGYREDQLLGQDQHRLIHHHRPDGEAYPHAECPIFQTLRDGRTRQLEEWFIDRDGTGFPVEMSVAPIERSGVRTGAVVAFHDIRARQAAQARDRLLVSALEAAANGIVITDQDAHIEWVNPAFEDLTGYSRAEAMGRRPAELVKSGLQDEPFYKAMWQTILSGRTWRGEVVNKKRDGSLYHEELIIAPVLDAAGAIRHFVGIKQDIGERKRLEAELHNLATTDPLTGLPNRRHFLALLEQETARLQRSGEACAALLMLDLDHFKRINDDHGHAAGDAILRRFAELLRDSLRKTDQAGRLGGEEFAILLFATHAAGATEFAERLRERVAADAVAFDGRTLRITVSIGVSRLARTDSSADDALARADAALYRAKANGRNRVETA